MTADLAFRPYRAEDALLLAGFSYQAYALGVPEGPLLPKGYGLVAVFSGISGVSDPRSAPFAFIAESDERLVLVFRGSADLDDVETDLDLFQVPFPFVPASGLAHRGMVHVYESLREGLFGQMARLPDTKPLFVTGHSLGADLALLSSFDLASNTGFRDISVYTLAAGRPGDPVFAAAVDRALLSNHRIYNVHDMIPTLPAEEYPAPFTSEGIRYRHAGEPHPLAFQCDDSFLNHRIDRYVRALADEASAYAAWLAAGEPGFLPGICAS